LLQDKNGELKAVSWEEKERAAQPKKEIPLAAETFEVVEEAKENYHKTSLRMLRLRISDEGKLF